MHAKRIQAFLLQVENQLASISLILISLLPALEVIARTFFKTGIHSSTGYIQHLVLWIAFAGGMITSREGKHLALSAGIDLIEEPYNSWITSITSCIAAGVASSLAWSSFYFMRLGFDPNQMVGMFPTRYVMLIMPLGFAVITLRFITHAPKGIVHKIIAASGVGIAAIFGFALAGQMSNLIWPCSIILVIAALAGTPIFIVLGGFAVLLFFNSGGTVTVIPNEAYTMLTGPIIPTIPLFTFAGFILSESKAGERLVDLFRAAFAWLPGGLAIMATIVCAFFTTFTGASGVTILALGGLLSFILVQSRYPKEFSTGLLTGSGSIGLLFPPSLPIILYGVVAHVNIKEMFVGGILPGTVMVLTVAILGINNALKHKVERTPFRFRKTLSALRKSIWEIALPFIIIVLFFKGITTLVETGSIAVLYVLIVEVFIHRDIKLKDFPTVFMKCIPMIGGVLMILAVARGLSYFIVDAEIPMQLARWCQLHIYSKYLFLIALNFALLITGCFMDIFSAIMVVAPLIIPLGQAFGIHPVHLGIIFLANLELGYLTPPVGLNLFLASFRFNEPLTRIYHNVIPFLIALFVAVLLITYIPWLTTGLLGVFGF